MESELRLKKNIGAIQSKPDSGLTLLQRKLFNVCLFHAYDHLIESEYHRIHIDLLHHYLGYRGNNWTKIEKAFQGLQSTLVCWNLFGQASAATSQQSWIRVQYIGSVAWQKSTKEFIYSFHKDLAEKLFRPERYAIISLDIQKKFKSEHALVLYEQCMRYKTNTHGSRWFFLDELKDVLAIDRAAYHEFKQFNSKVIKPAVREINSLTDITVSVSLKRRDRQVCQIKFSISPKNHTSTSDENMYRTTKHTLSSQLKQIGLKSSLISRLIKQHGSQKLQLRLSNFMKLPDSSRQKLHNPAGYFVSTLLDKQSKVSHGAQRKHRLCIERIEKQLQSAVKRYKKSYNLKIETFLDSLESDKKQLFFDEFYQWTTETLGPFIKMLLSKYGPHEIMKTPSMHAHRRQFALQYFPDLAATLPTFEDYLSAVFPDLCPSWRWLKQQSTYDISCLDLHELQLS